MTRLLLEGVCLADLLGAELSWASLAELLCICPYEVVPLYSGPYRAHSSVG